MKHLAKIQQSDENISFCGIPYTLYYLEIEVECEKCLLNLLKCSNRYIFNITEARNQLEYLKTINYKKDFENLLE
jgi:hypothetical protein